VLALPVWMLQIVYHFNHRLVGSSFSKEQGRLEQKLFDNTGVARIFAAGGCTRSVVTSNCSDLSTHVIGPN